MTFECDPPFTRHERRRVLAYCLALLSILLFAMSWYDSATERGHAEVRPIHRVQP